MKRGPMMRREFLKTVGIAGAALSASRWTHAATSPAPATPAAAPATVTAPPQSTAWLDCRLGPMPGREKARLLIMTLGDRVERAVMEPMGMAAVDVSGLKMEGGRITGQITVAHERREQNHSVPTLASRMPLRLDLAVDGGQVKGTFSGSWPRSEKSPTVAADVKGEVSGVRLDDARLRAENGLAADATWPSWLGPNQNFSSGPCARPVVDDLNKSRMVWASQYIGPCESGSQRYGACVGVPPAAGGGASPLVSKGRVYQFRYQAAGDVYQKFLDDQMAGPRGDEWRQKMAAVGWTDADMRRRWSIDADEQLVCIDAATGRTLWTVTWPGEGINLFDHKCSLTNHTGAVADGKVFVFGALGIVRCVSADTGEVLWRTEVPGYSDYMRKFKADALAKRNIAAPTRSFLHGLSTGGAAVIAPDGIGACGLVGLDAASGKVLWRAPGVLGGHVTPPVWTKDGKAYVIAASNKGVVTCLRADDGTVAWKYDKAGAVEGTPLLVGDLLILPRLTEEERKALPKVEPGDAPATAPGDNIGRLACLALSPQGAEEKWVSPVEWGAPWYTPVGTASGDLICFRGNYRYHVVRAATGERIASTPLSAAVRWDEGTMMAVPGMFIPNPDSQHGNTKMFTIPAAAGAKCGPMWQPPHPPATTYEVAMSHAWADGRLFIRGNDALYCYDLRRPAAS